MDTKLIRKKEVAEGTMCFDFERPDGFTYRAGQSIDLTLINPPETDAEGNTRAYTLSSAPQDEHLSITTRMRDTAFKRVIKGMEAGTPLSFEGPFGDLVLHENTARPAVFLAGGIGITPFYSIVRDALSRTLPHRMFLFYSNRRPEDAAYLKDLIDLSTAHSTFSLIATMTDMVQSKEVWEGEQGYITKEMLERHGALGQSAIYYLAGPAAMVAALRTMLNESGVSNDDIRTEEFTGY